MDRYSEVVSEMSSDGPVQESSFDGEDFSARHPVAMAGFACLVVLLVAVAATFLSLPVR